MAKTSRSFRKITRDVEDTVPYKADERCMPVQISTVFITLLYCQFRLCITTALGKAHTPMVARILRLPPGGSWRRRRLRENALHEGFHEPKVAQAPSVTAMPCHLPLGGRLSVSLIITQIGRENNISAEIYVSWTVEDACPYNFGLSKHP